MKVYFLRHGESVSNEANARRAGTLATSSVAGGDALTDRGWEQGRALGVRLKNEGITHLISSPMVRTQETAAAVDEVLKIGVELNNDIFEYQQATEFYEAGSEQRGPLSAENWMVRNPDPNFSLEGAESFNDVVGRAKRFQNYLLSHRDKSIAVATHGNFLRFFFGASFFREHFEPKHFLHLQTLLIDNTGISVFEYSEPHTREGVEFRGWRLKTWNDEAHL